MKILFLCHRFPLPPEGGGKIRALHIIRHLLAAGHELTVCSLVRSRLEQQGAKKLAALGARVIAPHVREPVQWARMLLRLATPQPVTFGYFYSAELEDRVQALLREEVWDLVFACSSSMGPYVSGLVDVAKIIDFVDMDSQKWFDYARAKPLPANILYSLEGRRLERAEQRLARSFDSCATVSRGELDTLRRLASDAPSDWFPNGVDLEYFTPSAEDYDPNLIVFVGRMDYYPNEQAMRWFCSAVWPALRSRRPSLRLKIVGANPPSSVRRLAGIAGVDVTGFVPDVRPHVQPALASIAPLFIARGMQNKVLECMAMGVPVVATARVADGLGLGRDSPVRVAETPDEYVAALHTLAESAELRRQLAMQSRARVEAEFSWSAAMRKLDEIVGAVTSDDRPRHATRGAST
jgi:sugar transferase (PEP-CTERM/EpsH1 system associated)